MDASGAMIDVQQDGPIAVVTLTRPDKLNALTQAFWPEMRETLAALVSAKTRAMVLTGAGTAFCAGGDIAAFQALTDEHARREFQADAMATFSAIEQSPVVVIAAVNGPALGGGCELALASDIVIAGDAAMFAMPESALGLTPGFGVLRGPDVIGRHWTKLMVFGGERINAAKAYEIGLAQIRAPDHQLMECARDLARRIAGMGPLALRYGKELINRGIDPTGFDHSTDRLTVLQGSADTVERVAAFLERRRTALRKDASEP